MTSPPIPETPIPGESPAFLNKREREREKKKKIRRTPYCA